MSRMTVVALSDSFARLWEDLAADLGVAIEVLTPDRPVVPAVDLAATVLAAGGAERDALQWIDEHPLAAGIPTLVVGVDRGRRAAVPFVARGASDYFALPDDIELLRNALVAAVQRHGANDAAAPRRVEVAQVFEGIVGESSALRAALAKATRIMPHRHARVLLLGETGTGKEGLARAIHAGGPRRGAPFVPVNCSALPEHLIESELFGHERGSFTDAHAAKPGLFEVADGGTLFLDEIGTLPLALQAKLLRALDDKLIRRVGGTKSRAVDVRILSATNEDLAQRVRDGTFREDLYFRLSTVIITLPPLRDRDEDAVLIAEWLLVTLAAEHDIDVPSLTPDLKRQILAHPWPGNVRELKNAVERALLLSPPGELLLEELLTPSTAPVPVAVPFPFPAPLREITTAVAHATVKLCRGNRSASARQLGISTKRLRRLLAGKDYDTDDEETSVERSRAPAALEASGS